jgi:CRISPR/Cas system-associated exonuclease Cas4 (RecB family)
MHWTISRLKDFEACPKRFEFKYVSKVPEPGPKSPALARGIEIHEACERFIDGRDPSITHPEISNLWRHQIESLKYFSAVSEEQWEFDEGWYPLELNATLWLRMKIDAYYQPSKDLMHVIDFKTGRPYGSNIEQVEVYAIGAFSKFDDVETVVGELWYLDHEEPHEKTFHRNQVSKLARKWEQRAERMLEAKAYPAKPAQHCRWCPFRTICNEGL